jgi:hypothetical protein
VCRRVFSNSDTDSAFRKFASDTLDNDGKLIVRYSIEIGCFDFKLRWHEAGNHLAEFDWLLDAQMRMAAGPCSLNAASSASKKECDNRLRAPRGRPPSPF